MGEPFKVDLGVRITPKGPEHVHECQGCFGTGGRRGLLFDGSYAEWCEDCAGTGELVAEDCDCSVCIQVAEDLERVGHA